MTPDGTVLGYAYDADGNLVTVQNQTAGGAKRYGYSRLDPHRLTVAVRSTGDSTVVLPGTATTAYLQGDLGDAGRFTGRTLDNILAAGDTDRFAFRFEPHELRSTASGTAILA